MPVSLKAPAPQRRSRGLLLLILLLAVAIGARSLAGYALEVEWWRELGQLGTFFTLLAYSVTPHLAAGLLAFLAFYAAHARALRVAGVRTRDHLSYQRIVTLVLLGAAVIVAIATVDSWTVVRFFGSRGLPAGLYRDPVFGHPLGFYLFSLPFWSMLLRVVLTTTLVSALVYGVALNAWRTRDQWPSQWRPGTSVDLNNIRLDLTIGGDFFRIIAVVFLLGQALRYILDRYTLLFSDHSFMVGVDYVDDNIRLPLYWLYAAVCLLMAVLVLLRRYQVVAALALLLVLPRVVPTLVSAAYVRPNEVSLQRPYLERHLTATRAAYGLEGRVRQREYEARLDGVIDVAANEPLLRNVRLWDWRAFHDTVMQIQALRPYYTFADTDVDRYQINGRLQQVLLTPRELDVTQLADARTRWINSHFVYTHGYGLVMAEANQFTPDGLPVTLIQDAPPTIRVPGLKFTRPELYYGEVTHEPVFVRTAQEEFHYPSGADNVQTRYGGRGGFPVGSLPMRIAAALAYGDANILLTTYLTGESRMMVRRNVRDRVGHLAGFLDWDEDPYLVLTPEGRQVWILDGYTTSAAHPYSRPLRATGGRSYNYIRNSVKATVDAYDGSVTLYAFDEDDPVLLAYRRLLPGLFQPASAMPAELRAHVRYPEAIFSAQAEIFRAYHMRDPVQFYNREDLWDVARALNTQQGQAQFVEPNYLITTLPGESQPEFVLMLPFTPRGKDNMIGLMIARCDGPRLGEIEILRLSKQSLVYGPMMVEARINQDQTISKDLSLWNQQGSQVLRGQMAVLPVSNTFLYVEPIYIQSAQSRMPQLKKIALAVGNRLIYTDTYQEALAQLGGGAAAVPSDVSSATGTAPGSTAAAVTAPAGDERLERARGHLRRYRELAGRGQWGEAGKELEALQTLLQ